jgi:hypothetical protein
LAFSTWNRSGHRSAALAAASAGLAPANADQTRPTQSPTEGADHEAAVELFRRAVELKDAAEAAHACNRGPVAGPIKSAYLDAKSPLNRALGIMPWQISPLDVDGSWAKPQAHDNPNIGTRRSSCAPHC